jgi:hypothetical protein
VRELWFEWLREHRPDLIPRYGELYRRGAYMPVPERERLSGLVKGPEQTQERRMRGRVLRRGAPEPRNDRGDHPAPVRRNEQQRLF